MNINQAANFEDDRLLEEQVDSMIREIQQDTFQLGYREGRIEARICMIRRMRRLNMSWNNIELITGISRADYLDLQDYWPELRS